MNNWIGALGAIVGFLGIMGSYLALRFSTLTFIVLLILNVFNVIAIGWWVIGAPILMIFGGIFMMLISTVFAGAFIGLIDDK